MIRETKELFIPYKLALLAKDKGFDYACLASWSNSKKFNLTTGGLMYKTSPCEKEFCIAPLYQQIIDWLCHRYNIMIRKSLNGGYEINWWYDGKYIEKSWHGSIDEGIEEAFKLI